MAQYKVPQDVEAEDKLLGPFTFRQFIYLLIVAGMCGAAWALFQIFPLLAIIPVPIIIFFGALALPLKKDQPMEIYLGAIVSFHLKPRQRRWRAGYPNSLIQITAPKIVEEVRTNGLAEREAARRLSFLAGVIDSEGYSVKNPESPNIHQEILTESLTMPDPLDPSYPPSRTISNNLRSETEIHEAQAISNFQSQLSSTPIPAPPTTTPLNSPQAEELAFTPEITISTMEKRAGQIYGQTKQNPEEVFVPLH